MKAARKLRNRKGYTLVELSLAMGIGVVVASMGLLLFNQQLAFLRIFKAQDFLTREAPMINNYVVRVLSTAEDYRLYEDIDALKNGSDPVLTGARVLVLRFREANGTMRASVLSFEDPGTGTGLYYTMIPEMGSITGPDWALSKQPSLVSFAVEQGVLRMQVTGPNGEELIYSGTQQL